MSAVIETTTPAEINTPADLLTHMRAAAIKFQDMNSLDFAYNTVIVPVAQDIELYVEVIVNDFDAAYVIFEMTQPIPFVTKSFAAAERELKSLLVVF